MKDTVLSQLAALKGAPADALKARWRELFDTEPPAYNRRFLESRLAYRIQELAYGGLSRDALDRLKALAKQHATTDSAERKARPTLRPVVRHQVDPGMGGRRALRHGAGRGFRVHWAALQILVVGGPANYRHQMERMGVLRPKALAGAQMTSARPRQHRKAQSVRADIRQTAAGDFNGPARKLRCAVYTRKSSEEGLDMDFNSLDAQREACEAYVNSQRGQGWILVPDRYDDGGVSGGTLDRPALKRLLADIEAGKIDIVVVYKIDRLSRSSGDFHKIIELIDRHRRHVRVGHRVLQY